jgi:hypothetical protein
VGAVTLVDGGVVASRHNERELTGDPTAHAEMLALRDTARRWAGGASIGSDPGGDPRALPHVRRGVWWPPVWDGWFSVHRPPGRCLRDPLQPL